MSETILCKGCGEPFDPQKAVHLCYVVEEEDAPTLADFWECDDEVRVVVGPLGSGKSSACINQIIDRAACTPACRDKVRRSRWLVVRCTYPELRDTTKKTFDQWIPNPSAIAKIDKNSFSGFIRFGLDDGTRVEAEVLFRAFQDEADVEKMRSLEITGAYFNELKELPKGAVDMVLSRIGRFPSRADVTTPENPDGTYWHGLWADTNPCDTDHWLYKLFEKSHVIEQSFTLPDGTVKKARWRLFKQPSGLGPNAENLRFLPPGYYEKQQIGKDADWIKVNLGGEWGFVRVGKPVFPMYEDSYHCVATAVGRPDLPILVGMDFGLTPAAVLAQRIPGSGQIQVFDELVSEDMGAVNFARELRGKILREYPGRQLRGWGDPAGEGRSQVDERTPYDVLAENGLGTIAPAPTNDLRRRLEAVSGILQRRTMVGPAYVISPKCAVLRKGFMGGYARARVKVAGEERYHDEPVKNRYSHVHDADQYLLVGEGEDDRAIHGTTKQRKVKQTWRVRRAVKGW